VSIRYLVTPKLRLRSTYAVEITYSLPCSFTIHTASASPLRRHRHRGMPHLVEHAQPRSSHYPLPDTTGRTGAGALRPPQ